MPAFNRANGKGSNFPQQLVVANAPNRPVNNMVPLETYYRSIRLLERQACQYRQQNNLEQLYVFLHRHASLLVYTIPKHKDFRKDSEYLAFKQVLSDRIIPEIEALKFQLQLKDSQELVNAPFKPKNVPGTTAINSGLLPELHWETEEEGRKAEDVLAFLNLPDTGGAAPATNALPDLSSLSHMKPASQAILSKHAALPQSIHPMTSSLHEITTALKTAVPSVPGYPPMEEPDIVSSIHTQPTHPLSGQITLGPQEFGVLHVPPPNEPPPPGASCCEDVGGRGVPIPLQSGIVEVKKRESMRRLHVSTALMDEFLRYAVANTRRGIESCGILAGTLSPDDATFSITSLIIPKQEGTSDTVHALNEEEIFEAQDSRSLYPLGWIHTHPSQTCFLSSIDVHTQCGYQTMLDESVAIVMAPKDPQMRVGIFRLTTPGGLELIQKCEHRGFHAHPPTATGQPLYDLSQHVYLNPRIDFEIVDLR